jgi:retron-type reverse transcriptase
MAKITFCVRGVISPTLANLTLDGLERLLKETFRKKIIRGQCYRPKVNFVRYADDCAPRRREGGFMN